MLGALSYFVDSLNTSEAAARGVSQARRPARQAAPGHRQRRPPTADRPLHLLCMRAASQAGAHSEPARACQPVTVAAAGAAGAPGDAQAAAAAPGRAAAGARVAAAAVERPSRGGARAGPGGAVAVPRGRMRGACCAGASLGSVSGRMGRVASTAWRVLNLDGLAEACRNAASVRACCTLLRRPHSLCCDDPVLQCLVCFRLLKKEEGKALRVRAPFGAPRAYLVKSLFQPTRAA
jgi:hypothetical protein